MDPRLPECQPENQRTLFGSSSEIWEMSLKMQNRLERLYQALENPTQSRGQNDTMKTPMGLRQVMDHTHSVLRESHECMALIESLLGLEVE